MLWVLIRIVPQHRIHHSQRLIYCIFKLCYSPLPWAVTIRNPSISGNAIKLISSYLLFHSLSHICILLIPPQMKEGDFRIDKLSVGVLFQLLNGISQNVSSLLVVVFLVRFHPP